MLLLSWEIKRCAHALSFYFLFKSSSLPFPLSVFSLFFPNISVIFDYFSLCPCGFASDSFLALHCVSRTASLGRQNLFFTTLTSLSSATCSFLSSALPFTPSCCFCAFCLANKWLSRSYSNLGQSTKCILSVFILQPVFRYSVCSV